MNYSIKIVETYSRIVNVESNSLEDAIEKIGNQHENEEIELMGEYDHYDGVEFNKV